MSAERLAAPPPDTFAPQILVLSDLQNDLVNPHDCARKLNQLQVRLRSRLPQRRVQASRSLLRAHIQTPERVLLGLQALTYAVAGRWLMMLVSAAQLAYLLHKAQRGGSSLHAADMISALPQEKRARIWRLALCGALLILIVIRYAGATRTPVRSSLTRCD